jgi:Tfp pilus assembly protein PilF
MERSLLLLPSIAVTPPLMPPLIPARTPSGAAPAASIPGTPALPLLPVPPSVSNTPGVSGPSNVPISPPVQPISGGSGSNTPSSIAGSAAASGAQVFGSTPSSGQPIQLVSTSSAAQNAVGTTGPAGAYITAALGHLAAGRIEAAYTSVAQAHALEQENALVHRIFGQVFSRRVPSQVDLAIKAYAHSLQLNPNDAETHKLMGDIGLFLRPQPAQAIQSYIQALKLNPQDAETHFRLGQCYEKTSQLDSALRAYQEAVKAVPKQPMQPALAFTLALGQLAQRMNQYPIAETALVQALTLDPGAHMTRFQLCRVYEIQNKLDDAFRECGYVIAPLNTNPEVQQTYTRLRTHLGR